MCMVCSYVATKCKYVIYVYVATYISTAVSYNPAYVADTYIPQGNG